MSSCLPLTCLWFDPPTLPHFDLGELRVCLCDGQSNLAITAIDNLSVHRQRVIDRLVNILNTDTTWYVAL
jgi:hypothetical protein